MRALLAVMGLALLASCNSAADDTLAASDLTYVKEDKGWMDTITIDPWLASHPDLVRHLKAMRIKAMDESKWDCAAGFSCTQSSEFRLMHDGSRLVSVIEENTVYGGGAHEITGLADYLYDLEATKRLRFGDIFASWEEARPVLQREFCESLRWQYEAAEECPDIQKQAIALSSSPLPAKVSAFQVETQDYALGYFAAGRAAVQVDVTREIMGLLKPEFREEFETNGAAG